MTTLTYNIYLDVKYENGIIDDDCNFDDYEELVDIIDENYWWKDFDKTKKLAMKIYNNGSDYLKGNIVAVRIVEVVDSDTRDICYTECIWDTNNGDL